MRSLLLHDFHIYLLGVDTLAKLGRELCRLQQLLIHHVRHVVVEYVARECMASGLFKKGDRHEGGREMRSRTVT
jgi:hypothetical protein